VRGLEKERLGERLKERKKARRTKVLKSMNPNKPKKPQTDCNPNNAN